MELTGFTQAQLSGVMARMFALGADQGFALRARLKHMQLLGFPRAGVRKGNVATYCMEDAMKIAVGFALLEVGMPSVRACDLVEGSWAGIREAMLSAALEGDDRAFAVEPHALASIGRRGFEAQRRLERGSTEKGWELDRGRVFSATTVVIDLSSLVQRLVGAFAGEKLMDAEGTRSEFVATMG